MIRADAERKGFNYLNEFKYFVVAYRDGIVPGCSFPHDGGQQNNVAVVVISGYEERHTLFRALSISHNAFLNGSLEPVLPNGAIFPTII